MLSARQIAPALLVLGLAACRRRRRKRRRPRRPRPSTNPVDPATAGDGDRPRHVHRQGAGASADHDGVGPALHEHRRRQTETVVAGANGALQNVFVYVKDGLGNLAFPVPTTPVVLDQKGCQYRPHVFGVQVGQPVEILNSDATLHNIHALPMTNQEFNVGQPLQGLRTPTSSARKEVMVPFKCDVHKWMNAFVGVLDHPFYAVTGATARSRLKGLPPGTYTVEAWHETLGTKTQSVTVGAKETKDVAFSFAG